MIQSAPHPSKEDAPSYEDIYRTPSTFGHDYTLLYASKKIHVRLCTSEYSQITPKLKIKQHDFSLVAAGTRKVTFLSISVYNIGIYIDTEDISVLNAALKDLYIDSLEDLQLYLQDPMKGSNFLDRLNDVSFSLRITPVRNTDIAHMRDGFVRGILLRYDPDEQTLKAFKEFFPNPRRAFLKDEVMSLTLWKNRSLDLDIDGHDYGTFQAQGEEAKQLLRAFFGTYTSGKKVADEPLRREFIQQIIAGSQ